MKSISTSFHESSESLLYDSAIKFIERYKFTHTDGSKILEPKLVLMLTDAYLSEDHKKINEIIELSDYYDLDKAKLIFSQKAILERKQFIENLRNV